MIGDKQPWLATRLMCSFILQFVFQFFNINSIHKTAVLVMHWNLDNSLQQNTLDSFQISSYFEGILNTHCNLHISNCYIDLVVNNWLY